MPLLDTASMRKPLCQKKTTTHTPPPPPPSPALWAHFLKDRPGTRNWRHSMVGVGVGTAAKIKVACAVGGSKVLIGSRPNHYGNLIETLPSLRIDEPHPAGMPRLIPRANWWKSGGSLVPPHFHLISTKFHLRFFPFIWTLKINRKSTSKRRGSNLLNYSVVDLPSFHRRGLTG